MVQNLPASTGEARGAAGSGPVSYFVWNKWNRQSGPNVTVFSMGKNKVKAGGSVALGCCSN